MSFRVSIVIPNYNEKANLEAGALDEVLKYLKKAPFKWEVVVSDDGSSDGSLDLIRRFIRLHPGFKLLENPHGGKAAAVASGVKASKGDVILFTDMDQSTPLKEIEKLLPFYEEGYDVVFGSRGKMRENTSIVRKIMSWGFRHFRQLILFPNIIDTQCGFKSFKTPIAKKLFPKLSIFKRSENSTGWNVSAFDVELLFLAEKRGYRLKEVEVNWTNRDRSTSKKKNFLTESVDMLKQIFQVKLNDLRGVYN